MKISEIARNLGIKMFGAPIKAAVEFEKQKGEVFKATNPEVLRSEPPPSFMMDKFDEPDAFNDRRPNTDPPPAPPAKPLFDIEKSKKAYEMMEEKGFIKKKRPVTIKLPPNPDVIHIDDLQNKVIIDNDGNELLIIRTKIEENPHLHPYKTLTASLIKPFDLAK